MVPFSSIPGGRVERLLQALLTSIVGGLGPPSDAP
jgi:hypothetical protein